MVQRRASRAVSRFRPRMLAALAVVVSLTFAGCLMEPERTNPADPNSPVFNNDGRLYFKVIDRGDQSLYQAQVHLQGYDLAQYTNADGEVWFDVPADTIYYVVDRDQYVSQTGQVVIRARRTTQQTVKLNGRPYIDSVKVYTTMIPEDANSWQYGYVFTVYAGDFDSADDITNLEFYKPGGLTPELLPGEQLISIPETVGQSARDLTDLLGRDFRFVLLDEPGDTAEVHAQITSFLHYPYLTDDMIVSAHYYIGNMTFEWYNNAGESLWFTPDRFRLQVFETDHSDPALVDTTIVFANPDLLEMYQVTITRTDGFIPQVPRWWQLTMYDPFGNFVQSSKKSFLPEANPDQ